MRFRVFFQLPLFSYFNHFLFFFHSQNYFVLTDEKSSKKKTEIKEKTSRKNLAFTEIFGKKRDISGHFIITTIFMSNFIGIAFARTLHYQFYVWYFHTIPYLLWHTGSLPLLVKIFVFFSIEVAFNIYPATWWSSALLQVRIYEEK